MNNHLILLLVNPFLYGVIFLLVIYIGKKPKKRNAIYGYRTARAMKSEEAFHFANELFFKMFTKVSWGMVVLGLNFPLIVQDLFWNAMLGILAFVLGFGLMIYRIEKTLKERFG